MSDLQARMDSIFADAFHTAGDWFNRSKLASSVDLREQRDRYVARIYLPQFDTSKVDVKIKNSSLHIKAESRVDGKTETQRYEQNISLPKPVRSNKMQIDRKQDLLVIMIPKETASAPSVASSSLGATPAGSPAVGTDEWESTMSNQFGRIGSEIAAALRELFPNDYSLGVSAPQLESAVRMDEQPDKYVIHFFLPDRNVSNVNVKFENGQLSLAAEERSKTSSETDGGSVQGTSVGEYRAMISVPGPVKESDMKADRQANAVVVTLPKA